MTLVYYKSPTVTGGWACDAMSAKAAELIIGAGIYFDRDTGFLRRFPTAMDFKLLKVHQNRTLEIIAAENVLASFLYQSEQYESQKRKNSLRERYGKVNKITLEKPPVLNLYERDTDLVNANCLILKELRIDLLVKWKYSTFSLHCYAIARDKLVLRELLHTLSSVQGLQFIECSNDSLIPVV